MIGRRLATGFGLVAVTALAMCAVLLSLLANVARSVHLMRNGERDVHESLALAMSVREEYIHQAHTIIEGNHSHLAHYEAWLTRVHEHANALLGNVTADDRTAVREIVAESAELDRVFRTELLPALDRNDQPALKALHRQAEKLSFSAVSHADALVQRMEAKMNGWHLAAIEATRHGLFAGASCMLVVILLSVYYTRRIRRSVVRPLEALALVARRLSQGDFSTLVGDIGEGEFQSVGRAWNRMVEELQAREARVIRVERMASVGQLAAGVAHEINNPIGVIRGYLRTMSPEDPPDSLREELRILDDEAAACQRIADDLLAFARAEELSIAPVVIDELLAETVRRFAESGEVGAQGIDVDAEAMSIAADGRRLRQVVLNLLRNAVQSAPEAELVEVTGRRLPGDGYEICVLDRGPGVPRADEARIFEPFFSRRDGGSGLGLAVCSGIVRAHGGQIEVEPRPGGGSVFRLTLPRRPPQQEQGAS